MKYHDQTLLMNYPVKRILKVFLTLAVLVPAFLRCTKKNDFIIVTDDILMLNKPAAGVERDACETFPSQRTFSLPASGKQNVDWSEGKSLPQDTLKIIRLDIRSDTGSLVQFTMTLRPLSGKPSEIQCMKGFGCTPPWEQFPWIAPGENFLDHTVFKFRVIPTSVSSFTIENYNSDKSLTVRVNPPI